MINGLKIAIELGIKRLEIRGDSQLVIDQVMKEFSCHNETMAAYCAEVRKLEEKFHGLELKHILRRYNETADALAKMASRRETPPPGIFVSDLATPSIRPRAPKEVGTSADPRVPTSGEPKTPDPEGPPSGAADPKETTARGRK